MKKLLGIMLLAAITAGGCLEESSTPSETTEGGSPVVDPSALTTIQWIDSVKEMGKISEGQKLEVVFRFSNSGQKPLVIQSAQPSCGCTVPSKPDKPIMPGQQGEIKAVFDSKGRPGSNHKTITVMANTEGSQSHLLEFNVEVIGEKEGPKAVSGPNPQGL